MPYSFSGLPDMFLALKGKRGLGGQIAFEIYQEGETERLEKVIDLAKRCMRLKGEERPSVQEVVTELESLPSKSHDLCVC